MNEQQLREWIIEAIRTVEDPEIPVNLYDLGLIYDLEIDDDANVAVTMTLTTPNCPVAESMPHRVREAVAGVEEVNDVGVNLVWEPAWNTEMMSDDARAMLDMMGITWTDPRGGPSQTSLTVNRTSNQNRRQTRPEEPS